MKLVIDIDENDFLACKHWFKLDDATWAEAVIANGTPLPKGHGRLIDADALKQMLPAPIEDEYKYVHKIIDNAPTVDITEEQAIDKLHETGWMQRHDKEMTERTTGKECELMKRAFFNAVETANLIEKLKQEEENEQTN